MAKYTIYSRNGVAKYTGCPTFQGAYLKPGYLEFREIASPVPIEWEVGDYVDYNRTGLRYTLYTVPQQSVRKQARRGSYGGAFVYSNVQFFDYTKMVELAPFRDLVPDLQQNVHFSTQPAVAVFDDVYGIAERIETCVNDYAAEYALKSGSPFFRWVVEVVDASADVELYDTLHEELEYSVSGVSCLGALDKIYELWNNVGWTYSFRDGKHVITIGGADIRTSANTIPDLRYGLGNGLNTLESSLSNRNEMATRLYVYGSSKNMPSRWYNNLPYDIKDKESIDIQHLMIPVDQWGKTGNQYDASKAFLEDSAAIAKYGLIIKSVYFDGSENSEICPTIKGVTIGAVRAALGDSTARYYPDITIYPDPDQRVDRIASVVNPSDEGVVAPGGAKYSEQVTVNVPAMDETILSRTDATFTLLQSTAFTGKVGEIAIEMGMSGTVSSTSLLPSGYSAVAMMDNGIGTRVSIPLTLTEIAGPAGRHTYAFTIPDFSLVSEVPLTGSISVRLTFGNMAFDAETYDFTLSQGNAVLGLLADRMKLFTMKVRQIGFDINERMSHGSGKATVGMTSGLCSGRNFLVKTCTYNRETDDWTLVCFRQQDKSINTWFPNSNSPVNAEDSFVLFDIAMPDIYVTMAANKLLEEGRKMLARVSKPIPVFTPQVDAKVLQEMLDSSRTPLAVLREARYFHVVDSDVELFGRDYVLVDTVTISEGEAVIPTYKITLREEKKVTIKESVAATTADTTSSVQENMPSSTGGSGVSDYNQLTNLPALAGNIIKGAMEYADLGLMSGEDVLKLFTSLDWFIPQIDGSLRVNPKYKGLWADGYVSAGGQNDSGGGGGTGDILGIRFGNGAVIYGTNHILVVGDIPMDVVTGLAAALASKQDAATAITTGNIGSQRVSYAESAGSVSSVAWSAVTGKPNVIAVKSDGVAEVGQYFDFHHTSDTTSDYNVRLACPNVSLQTVNLPSESGTLALTKDFLPLTGGTLTGTLTCEGLSVKHGDYGSRINLRYSSTNSGGYHCIYTQNDDSMIRFSATNSNGTSWTYQDYLLVTRDGNVAAKGWIRSGNGGYGVRLAADNTINGMNGNAYGNLYLQDASANNLYLCTGGGKVGIGTNTPALKLDVIGQIRSYNAGLGDMYYLAQNSAGATYFGTNPNGNGYIQVSGYNALCLSTASTERMRITSDGNVGIGTSNPSAKLHVAGNIIATGQVTAGAASDARLKDNVEMISDADAVLEALRGVEFDWNGIATEKCNDLKGHDVGLIAQEVEKVIPSAVSPIFDEYKRVDYTKVVPYLVEGYKEQQRKIATLEERVKELERMISKLI